MVKPNTICVTASCLSHGEHMLPAFTFIAEGQCCNDHALHGFVIHSGCSSLEPVPAQHADITVDLLIASLDQGLNMAMKTTKLLEGKSTASL